MWRAILFICLDIYSLQGLSEGDCGNVIRALRGVKNPCVSFLWKSFSPSLDCPTRLKTTYPQLTFRTYATNSCCHRGVRICAKDELGWWLREPEYSRSFMRLLPRYGQRLEEIGEFSPQVVIPALEDMFSRETYSRIHNYTKRKLSKKITYARSQISLPLWAPAGTSYEMHADKYARGKPCGHLNNDGSRLWISDYKRAPRNIALARMSNIVRKGKRLGCRSIGLWQDRAQGSFVYKSFVYPRLRSLRFGVLEAVTTNQFLRKEQRHALTN